MPAGFGVRAHHEQHAELVVETDGSFDPEGFEIPQVPNDGDLVGPRKGGRALRVGLDANFAAARQQEQQRAQRGQSPHHRRLRGTGSLA